MRLHDIIAEKIGYEGPITFRDFMEMSLYHLKLGYYNRPHEKFGKRGDFYTAANVSEFFGQVIADEIVRCQAQLKKTSFSVVEFGAGSGQLAADILNYLQDKTGFNRLNYIIVEKSPYLITLQAKRLKDFRGRVIWANIEELIKQPISGVLLQNEVIDAFAVHRVAVHQGRLQEIYVDYQDDFIEVFGPLSTRNLSLYLEKYGMSLKEGQQAEINLEALEWLERISRLLAKGFIITIDYGGEAGEIYSPSRFQGTLVCYYRHQLVDNPYVRIGDQDITALVNFTALIRKGEELGWRTLTFTSQANFLVEHGIIERLEKLQHSNASESEKIKARLAIKNLIMPQAMGERYRVLIQQK